MKTLAEIAQRRDTVWAERSQRVTAHEAFLTGNDKELRDLKFAESLIAADVDLERIGRGSMIVKAHGSLRRRFGNVADHIDHRAVVVADAKSDIAAAAVDLRTKYYGVKNFANLSDQRCDCEYGHEPKHGFIVFSIALTEEARKQISSGTELSQEQIEDALYVLANLEAIQLANGVAA